MKTQTTKPGWGIVAMAGLLCACATIESSIMIALAGTAVFTFSAWKGGYMEGTSQQLRNDLTTPAKAGERRAA